MWKTRVVILLFDFIVPFYSLLLYQGSGLLFTIILLPLRFGASFSRLSTHVLVSPVNTMVPSFMSSLHTSHTASSSHITMIEFYFIRMYL